jgi:hypothetical protein
LTAVIDDTDAAILSSKVSIEQEVRFEPVINPNTNAIVISDYEITFLNTIAAPNDTSPVVTTDFFFFNSVLCRIQNKLSSAQLQIIDQDGNVQKDNIGELVGGEGKIKLNGFQPTSINSGNSYLRLQTTPADDSVIKPLRSNIVSLGSNLVTAVEDIDLANSTVGTTN